MEKVGEKRVNPAAEESMEVYQPAPVRRDVHRESELTRLIEQQAARIPSHWFLVGALGAMAGSLAFEIAGNERMSRFLGLWAPTLLITGVYNKLVKTMGAR